MLPFDDYIPSCILIVYSWIPMFYLKSNLMLSHGVLSTVHCVFRCVWRVWV